MNTLRPDTSITLVIPAGETLSLNGTGTVTNLGTNVVTEVNGVSTYGPFAGAVTVIVAAGSRRDVTVFPGVPVEVQDGSEPLSYQLSSEGGGGGGAALTPQQVAAGAVGVLASNNAGLAIEPDGDPLAAGGGGGATNLSATASPTGVTVASDTGTDAALPLADGTNAGLMAPAQHTKLDALPDAAALKLALQGKQGRSAVGEVGATPLVYALAGYGLQNRPHTLTVSPAAGTTITAESSTDDGATYSLIGSASAFTQWEYDLSPADAGWVTHLRLSRTAGSATTSTFSIRS